MELHYLRLRIKQFVRFYSFSDVHPLIGIPATVLLWVVLSLLIFHKAPYPPWLYLLVAIAIVSGLQSAKSNNYLLQNLGRIRYFRAKLAENALVLLPFLLAMAYFGNWWQMLIALILVVPFSYFNFELLRPRRKALPTPYPAYAFELNLAFRSFAPVYLIYIVLTIIGCLVDNFYVFLVPLFLLLLFLQTAQGLIEEPYNIWVYRTTATGFLLKKIMALLIGYAITVLPTILAGLVFYTGELVLLLLSVFAGLLALAGGMLIKYHFYPSELVVQITQMLFLGFTLVCIASPPMLLAVMLFMGFSFIRARKNLKTILKC